MKYGLFLILLLSSSYAFWHFTEPYPLQAPQHFGVQYEIPKDNPLTKEGVALGRKLFYDTRLSSDNSISCATCHKPELAFTDGLQASIGIRGQVSPRNAPSLANLLWQKKFFWDGRAQSLEEQVLHPIESVIEMDMSLPALVGKLQTLGEYPDLFRKAFGQKKITKETIAKALAQFVRTLVSGNSRYDRITRGEVLPTEQEKRAIALFFTHPIPEIGVRGANCGDCHGSHLTTLGTFHDNGLDSLPTDKGLGGITGKATDVGKMKTPSLRNIALTAPYMHDGRFKTLREVVEHYNAHIQNSPNLDPLIAQASNEVEGTTLKLTEQEKEDILLFLQMLTDSSFIQNKAFQNPFLREEKK
jgi:cytochrome c peroxidase